MDCKTIASLDDLTHQEWNNHRRKGVGGTDAGVIMGVSPYDTLYSLWAKKRGLVSDSFEGNTATSLGSAMEFPILQEYAKQSGQAVVVWKVMVVHAERYWQRANFDAFIVDPSAEFPGGVVTICDAEEFPVEPLAIVEVKTTGLVGRGNREAWFSEMGVPRNYYWQGVHYCAVTGLRNLVFVALIGGEGLVVREFEVNDEECEFLTETEAEFWYSVEEGIEPELVGTEPDIDTLKSIYPTHTEGKVVSLNEFEADLVNEYVQAKAEVEYAETKLNIVKAELMKAIGDAEAAEFNGSTLLTYKQTKPSERFDAKAFKDAQPEAYKTYTKTTPGYRVLRLKGDN